MEFHSISLKTVNSWQKKIPPLIRFKSYIRVKEPHRAKAPPPNIVMELSFKFLRDTISNRKKYVFEFEKRTSFLWTTDQCKSGCGRSPCLHIQGRKSTAVGLINWTNMSVVLKRSGRVAPDLARWTTALSESEVLATYCLHSKDNHLAWQRVESASHEVMQQDIYFTKSSNAGSPIHRRSKAHASISVNTADSLGRLRWIAAQ